MARAARQGDGVSTARYSQRPLRAAFEGIFAQEAPSPGAAKHATLACLTRAAAVVAGAARSLGEQCQGEGLVQAAQLRWGRGRGGVAKDAAALEGWELCK